VTRTAHSTGFFAVWLHPLFRKNWIVDSKPPWAGLSTSCPIPAAIAIVFSRYCVVTLLRIFCRYSNLVSLEWDQSEADGRLMPEEE
jgi:hypothetical protein